MASAVENIASANWISASRRCTTRRTRIIRGVWVISTPAVASVITISAVCWSPVVRNRAKAIKTAAQAAVNSSLSVK